MELFSRRRRRLVWAKLPLWIHYLKELVLHFTSSQLRRSMFTRVPMIFQHMLWPKMTWADVMNKFQSNVLYFGIKHSDWMLQVMWLILTNQKESFLAVVLAQLAKRLLPTPEVHGSNLSSARFYWTLLAVNCIEKTKLKKNRPGMAHFKKKNHF